MFLYFGIVANPIGANPIRGSQTEGCARTPKLWAGNADTGSITIPGWEDKRSSALPHAGARQEHHYPCG